MLLSLLSFSFSPTLDYTSIISLTGSNVKYIASWIPCPFFYMASVTNAIKISFPTSLNRSFFSTCVHFSTDHPGSHSSFHAYLWYKELEISIHRGHPQFPVSLIHSVQEDLTSIPDTTISTYSPVTSTVFMHINFGVHLIDQYGTVRSRLLSGYPPILISWLEVRSSSFSFWEAMFFITHVTVPITLFWALQWKGLSGLYSVLVWGLVSAHVCHSFDFKGIYFNKCLGDPEEDCANKLGEYLSSNVADSNLKNNWAP